jgi:hypothetical protein
VRRRHPSKGEEVNRDDIITAASKAGFETKRDMIWVDQWEISPPLARFAALVAAHALANIDPSKLMSYQEGYEAGRTAEREACAQVCEDMDLRNNELRPEYRRGLSNAACTIRARGKK